MPKRKETDDFAALGEKDCWHSYGLQMLTPPKFAAVVGKILRGNYALVNSKLSQDWSRPAAGSGN